MAARAAKARSLSDDEVAMLRAQLHAGKRPRVQLSGPQFPDGSAGTVTRIGDPATDGTDFVTVRVKVNGVTDELAFAPAELSLRSRAASGRGRVTARRPAGPAKAAGEPAPAAGPARSADLATAPPAKPASPAKPDVAATQRATAAGAAPAAGRRRKPAAPARVVITVSSTGAAWTVSATRGTKTVAKNVALQPGTVTALAELLDQPDLIDAVAEINDTALSAARARAEQLRAELEQLEAVLATHRSPR